MFDTKSASLPARSRRLVSLCILFITLQFALTLQATAEPLTIAVTADFSATLDSLSQEFKKQCKCEIKLVSASTGELYTRIMNGADYDVFFAADMSAPTKLVEEGKALIDSFMVYGEGILTLTGQVDLNKAKTIAIPNPELSPWGEAAMKYIDSLAYSRLISRKLVYTDNIADAWELARKGSAMAAFAPLSMSGKPDNTMPVKIIPQGVYVPLRQAAVILKESPTATALFAFIKSEKGRELITLAGYRVDKPGAGE